MAEIFTLMSRDEARHAGFLNKAMSDFNLALDLGFLTKNRKYTFFQPKFIFYATYLSEKVLPLLPGCPARWAQRSGKPWGQAELCLGAFLAPCALPCHLAAACQRGHCSQPCLASDGAAHCLQRRRSASVTQRGPCNAPAAGVQHHRWPSSWRCWCWRLIHKRLSQIGYWRYISIYRHLQRNPDNQLYPLFEYFENWCQDENRHGDFFTALLKSQPQVTARARPAGARPSGPQGKTAGSRLSLCNLTARVVSPSLVACWRPLDARCFTALLKSQPQVNAHTRPSGRIARLRLSCLILRVVRAPLLDCRIAALLNLQPQVTGHTDFQAGLPARESCA